jgi:hypothetical protein
VTSERGNEEARGVKVRHEDRSPFDAFKYHYCHMLDVVELASVPATNRSKSSGTAWDALHDASVCSQSGRAQLAD